jgi:hypothetical protein
VKSGSGVPHLFDKPRLLKGDVRLENRKDIPSGTPFHYGRKCSAENKRSENNNWGQVPGKKQLGLSAWKKQKTIGAKSAWKKVELFSAKGQKTKEVKKNVRKQSSNQTHFD